MSSDNLSKKQQKYQARLQKSKRDTRRRLAVNLALIIVGLGIIVLALVWPSLQPITDLVAPQGRSHPMADGNALGDPNAPITMEVFSDFKCPACEYFYQAIEPLIIQEFVETGDVYLVFHSYGDIIHPPESGRTAQAVYCAQDQGKFWDMHDYLFTNFSYGTSNGFSERAIETIAEMIGMDTNQFSDCLSSRKYEQLIEQDVETGKALNIPGTPSVIINGVLLNSFQFDDIQTAIETILSDNSIEE